MYAFDLGRHSWPVTTGSATAQRWFDRGVAWCHGFHHEEAIACFERALADDPGCAMAHWGIAFALGPNYNKPWPLFDPADRVDTLARARAALAAAADLAPSCSPLERDLIAALHARYPEVSADADTSAWDDAWAEALRPVQRRHPDNLDVLALYVEAMLDRRPWQLWDLKTGQASAGSDAETLEALCVQAFAATPGALQHPGLLHLYLHLVELSPWPERALAAAEQLRELVPDAGHLVHMPTHIDLLCGDYASVVRWNLKAIAADDKYLAAAGPGNFYTFYRVHNYHFAAYGAMFLGDSRRALAAADGLAQAIPEALLRVESPPMADYLEAYIGMKQHVLIRFGRWPDIIAQPLPRDPALYCTTTAMLHYAKGVAHAASGNVGEAERARASFLEAREAVPSSRRLHNNTCVDLLQIGAAMLDGELEYRRGNFEPAFAHLRRAVELEDALPYDEPWGWMQPTRHALGALLLEQGRLDEAEAVYRADLGLDASVSRACQHPDNVWSLHGLNECLRRRGAPEAVLVGQRLKRAAALADVPVTASCFCRRGTARR